MTKIELAEKRRDIEALRISLHEQALKEYANDYIFIGDFSYGNPDIRSWGEGSKLKIGKFCSIAEGVKIMLGGEHRVDWITTYPFNALLNRYSYITGHPKSKGDVIIENDVWIGTCATIMSGVHIGNGAVIGANALVAKDVPDYAIVGGNPARIIRNRFKHRIVKKLLKISWWDWKISLLADAIPILQSGNINELFKYYKVNKTKAL